MNKSIVLASRSPRRVSLLEQIGVSCHILPADIDETVLPDELPAAYVQRLAKEKALAVYANCQNQHLNTLVLGADTTVALGNVILGKPENNADAFQMLKMLSGSEHMVHTAVAACRDGECEVALSSTLVAFIEIDDTMINSYIDTGEHEGKAGSYGIQGLAAAWVKRIEGSYSGVMGLPLHETAQLLKESE